MAAGSADVSSRSVFEGLCLWVLLWAGCKLGGAASNRGGVAATRINFVFGFRGKKRLKTVLKKVGEKNYLRPRAKERLQNCLTWSLNSDFGHLTPQWRIVSILRG